MDNKTMTTNNFRIQAYNLIMFGYFCIGFIDFMFKGKSLLNQTNQFSPNISENNYNIIQNVFYEQISKTFGWEKSIVLSVKSRKNQKTKTYICDKTLLFSTI